MSAPPAWAIRPAARAASLCRGHVAEQLVGPRLEEEGGCLVSRAATLIGDDDRVQAGGDDEQVLERQPLGELLAPGDDASRPPRRRPAPRTPAARGRPRRARRRGAAAPSPRRRAARHAGASAASPRRPRGRDRGRTRAGHRHEQAGAHRGVQRAATARRPVGTSAARAARCRRCDRADRRRRARRARSAGRERKASATGLPPSTPAPPDGEQGEQRVAVGPPGDRVTSPSAERRASRSSSPTASSDRRPDGQHPCRRPRRSRAGTGQARRRQQSQSGRRRQQPADEGRRRSARPTGRRRARSARSRPTSSTTVPSASSVGSRPASSARWCGSVGSRAAIDGSSPPTRETTSGPSAASTPIGISLDRLVERRAPRDEAVALGRARSEPTSGVARVLRRRHAPGASCRSPARRTARRASSRRRRQRVADRGDVGVTPDRRLDRR